MHEMVWFLSLILMGLVALAFATVAAGASRKSDVARPYRGRAVLFLALLAAGAAITLGTLMPWPIEAHTTRAAAGAKVIHIVGHQWRWELSDDTVRVGEPVEFHVTASDVNHGFGIYRDRTRMVAQTQAMPGFVNRLRVVFDAPGNYELLCLEYCGVAHHGMVATLKVLPR